MMIETIRNQWIFELFTLLLLTLNFCIADYDVPPAKVDVFYPKGFRVSIPGIMKCVFVAVSNYRIKNKLISPQKKG